MSFVDVKIILLFLQPVSSPVTVWYLSDISCLIISLILHVIWYSFGPEKFEREIHACWYHVTDLKNILRICKRRGGGLTRVMKLNKRPMGSIAHPRNSSTQNWMVLIYLKLNPIAKGLFLLSLVEISAVVLEERIRCYEHVSNAEEFHHVIKYQ